MIFYNEVKKELAPWINHYWVLQGELDGDKIYEILPMDHSDIVMKVSGEFLFKKENLWEQAEDVFFQGIKTKPMYLKQDGYAQTLGISFKPWGLYGLINKSMDSFRDRVVDVYEVNKDLASELMDFTKSFLGNQRLNKDVLEGILMKYFGITSKEEEAIDEIREYLSSSKSIQDFSKDNNISRRKLERNFNKFIGISPVKFNGIRKFEDSSRELLYSNQIDMNDIVFEGEYYDQPHFNREFKKYTGKTPGKFNDDDGILKSSIKFSDK